MLSEEVGGWKPSRRVSEPVRVALSSDQRDSRKQCGEIPHRYDPGVFVTIEGKKPALVARDKIVSPTRFGQRKQKIIGRIRGSFDARQRADILGQFP